MEEIGCLSKSGIQFAPPSVVFHTPPATAPKRTDLPPTHSIEQFFIDRSGRRWSGGWSGSKRSWEKENRSSENDFNQVKRTVTQRGHPPKVKSLRFGSTGIARNAGRSARCAGMCLAPKAQHSRPAWGSALGSHVAQNVPALKARFFCRDFVSIVSTGSISMGSAFGTAESSRE